MQTVEISGRKIGRNNKCFVIAEAGVNFNGDLDMALKLVDVASESGADVVKFQTFNSDRVVTGDAPKAEYAVETTGNQQSHLDMMRSLEFTPDMHEPIIQRCASKGILFLSSPFDEGSADLLDDFGVSAFKIPSGEVTNIPFLCHIAEKKKPMIVSTGMCDLGEVDRAVSAIREHGNDQIILLHCVSNYPADPSNVNLKVMDTMSSAFGVPIGFSDHTIGNEIPLAAVAMGASVIEKHFTLDKSLPGPDHRASLEPKELEMMINGIRVIESAMGNGIKIPADSERNTADVARKSLVSSKNLSEGHVLVEEDIDIKRPGTGIPPFDKQVIIGRTLKKDLKRDTLFTREMFV